MQELKFHNSVLFQLLSLYSMFQSVKLALFLFSMLFSYLSFFPLVGKAQNRLISFSLKSALFKIFFIILFKVLVDFKQFNDV